MTSNEERVVRVFRTLDPRGTGAVPRAVFDVVWREVCQASVDSLGSPGSAPPGVGVDEVRYEVLFEWLFSSSPAAAQQETRHSWISVSAAPHEPSRCSMAAEYVALWQSGRCDEQAHAELREILSRCPLSGRMIHGFPPDRDPGFGRLLSSDEWKRLSWVFGPDALSSFLGKDARGICLELGFGETWLEEKLAQGKLFKLAVFPASSADAVPATWDGVEVLLESNYPDVWEPHVKRHYATIREEPFQAIQKLADYDMLQANLAGRDHATGESSDPNYMSLQRLVKRIEKGDPSVVEVRQWLWDEIGLKSLYKGDGFTYDDNSNRGPLEYLARNAPLADIQGIVVLDVVPAAASAP